MELRERDLNNVLQIVELLQRKFRGFKFLLTYKFAKGSRSTTKTTINIMRAHQSLLAHAADGTRKRCHIIIAIESLPSNIECIFFLSSFLLCFLFSALFFFGSVKTTCICASAILNHPSALCVQFVIFISILLSLFLIGRIITIELNKSNNKEKKKHAQARERATIESIDAEKCENKSKQW